MPPEDGTRDSIEGAAPVAGWSMGGFVAQAVACAVPERVKRLLLLATDPGGPEAVSPAASRP